MSIMTPSHARKTSRTPGLGAAWAVLVGTGATSVTYNVVHATQGARLEIALALLLGFMPAFIAACLSHVAAVLHAPQWVIAAVIAVMGAGMVLSASATASVVAPADPSWRGWLFGGTLDAGALLALWAIMASRRRKNEVAATAEAAETKAQTATAEAAQAVAERDAVKAELASVRAELGGQLAAIRAELEAVRRRASGRKSRPASGRKSRPASAPEVARTSAPEMPVASGLASAPELPAGSDADDEFSAEAQAFQIWLGDPTISGSKLGPMVGRTDSMGRAWVRKWKQDAPSGEPQERAEENSS